jgi:hypothetical protein
MQITKETKKKGEHNNKGKPNKEPNSKRGWQEKQQ